MLLKTYRLFQGKTTILFHVTNSLSWIIQQFHILSNKYNLFLLNSWLYGIHLASGAIFSVFAKAHLFIARRSAANIDFNRCDDTSVPKSQQRYNPNILRGIQIETSLVSILIDFCFTFFYTKSQPVYSDQMFRVLQSEKHISSIFTYVFLPLLYVVFTPSVQKHICTIFKIKRTSVTPKEN